MADYNRNRQDAYRQQYDWNDQGRHQHSDEDEPNYTNSENRGFRSGRYAGERSGEGGWQNRYERQMNTHREGDFDNDSSSQRPYGRHRERDYGFGSGSSGLSSGYSDFGGDYSRESRNLYDRGYQGATRRDYENKENRLGGANYDRYGDRGRYDEDQYSGGHGGFSSRGSYGRSDYGEDYGSPRYGQSGQGRYSPEREYGRSGRHYGRGDSEDRSWWDRTTDEVSSWFGDEDAERRRERDRYMRGQHRGKGPRNYSRSDDRIRDDINDRLSDDPFVDASDIEVNVSNGEVTLTGNVDHRSTKRRAEDLAESISGVKHVENRLRINQSTGTQNSGVTGMGTPSGASASQSSSPVPGSERSRTRESGQPTK